MFTGFPADGLALLAEFPALDKHGFRALGPRYAAGLQAPAKAFVTALGTALREIVSPGIAFEPKAYGSIAPINNDVRFDRGRPLYKDHLLLRFWEGADPRSAATLSVRLTADEVTFASGAAFADVPRWRQAVDAAGDGLATALAALAAATGATLGEPDLKGVPRPWPTDHPHGDLLRRRRLRASWTRPLPWSAGTPGFVGDCAAELARAAEVHRWLVAHAPAE